ncbi:MAG: hypothetical protein HFH92_12525 [Lachnospiraceae bacterium]|uniref:hypothetical protein n=1 Tax=uncultured Acetatifactor sp. TaxID=1671927 RepID=UPI0026370F64|nr:hypothetical protein [uncultured Acetatifactor sp.]MCI8789915.1 hypothetical protein [Lachnospiraceae bacterium]
MNIHLQNSNLMAFGQSRLFGGRLKSTAQKLERQAERDSQVAFFENQKANLKNIECSSPEEVARVLEMLHSYEDSIAAVKAQYNQEQMFHLMDEAKERGEEIAKAIEESEPKTPEERREEAVKEALGIEEEGGMLSDILDEVAEEQLTEALEDVPETAAQAGAPLDQEPAQAAAPPTAEADSGLLQPREILPELPASYKSFDALA